ncbi:hypothetical protein [Lentibacillus sp. CBA3610]|nr:hypothetical protein [Lentibacillus sp. CBA3610]
MVQTPILSEYLSLVKEQKTHEGKFIAMLEAFWVLSGRPMHFLSDILQ